MLPNTFGAVEALLSAASDRTMLSFFPVHPLLIAPAVLTHREEVTTREYCYAYGY